MVSRPRDKQLRGCRWRCSQDWSSWRGSMAGITEASVTDAGDRCGYDVAVNPAVFFSIGGAVLIVWGSIVAIFNKWACRFMKRIQRMYGPRASDMVTPRYVRLIGIFLATGGLLFLVLAFTGVLPNRVVSD